MVASSDPGSSKKSQFECNECDFSTRFVEILTHHIKENNHQYVNEAGSLHVHKEIKDGDIKYPCDKCEYVVTTTGQLKCHQRCKQDIKEEYGQEEDSFRINEGEWSLKKYLLKRAHGSTAYIHLE